MISEYKFGKVVIDGVAYSRDVIIMSGKGVIVPNWWREEGHLLQLKDLNCLSSLNYLNGLSYFLVGTGAYGLMKVQDKLIKELEAKGIKVLVEPTERICRLYNELIQKGEEKVIALLHLTC